MNDSGSTTADRKDGTAQKPEDNEVSAGLLAAGLAVHPVPRISDATPEDLRRAVRERRGPAVFSGLIDTWPARRRWNPDDLSRAHGSRPVTALMNLPSGGVLLPREQQQYEETLPFGDFLNAMRTTSPGQPCYLAYTRAEEVFSPSDYDFGALLDQSSAGTDTRVWVGSAGTRSMLHSDLKDNLFCQIWGRKHVVLAPWAYSRSVYPFPDNLVNSRIDLAAPRLDRFPRLRQAVLYAGTIGPGDVLFMPKGCWHDFRSQTPSISLNHWFGAPLGFPDYARLLLRLGPAYWAATARDFVRYGMLRRREKTMFFYSPPSTGKRLWDLVRSGNFSQENDPTKD